jgi:hypothetical protein
MRTLSRKLNENREKAEEKTEEKRQRKIIVVSSKEVNERESRTESPQRNSPT